MRYVKINVDIKSFVGCIYFVGISADNPMGTMWVQLPGKGKQISIYKDTIWMVNPKDEIYRLV